MQHFLNWSPCLHLANYSFRNRVYNNLTNNVYACCPLLPFVEKGVLSRFRTKLTDGTVGARLRLLKLLLLTAFFFFLSFTIFQGNISVMIKERVGGLSTNNVQVGVRLVCGYIESSSTKEEKTC